MVEPIVLLVITIALALVFDFINGMHDTANAIATSVSTRALSPRAAIVMSAVMNFAGAFLSTAVAKTIGKGIADPHAIGQIVIVSALIGAIAWNLITWYFGLPSSSSHALIGGIIGAVVWGHGFSALQGAGILKIVLSLFLSPVLGITVGLISMITLMWVFRRYPPGKVNRWFNHGQRFTAALSAFSHGSNDAQKSMGIITMALVSFGSLQVFHVPLWVKISCALAMALGTSTGGWRIIKTMGTRMIKLTPPYGCAAEASATAVILSATAIGAPVSTTHVISSCIMGVGAAKRISAVRWKVAMKIAVAWVFTIPASALIAALTYALLHAITKM